MEVTLYSIPPSHPAFAAKLMLRQAGIDHRVVELPAGAHPLALRAMRFARGTVPAMRIDGRRVQGSIEISRALDELAPDAALLPSDPDLRAEVEEAERWGEAEYQPLPRRAFRWALVHDPGLRRHTAEQAGAPLPGLAAHLLLPVTLYFARAGGASDEAVRRGLAALPENIERIDALLEAGTLGGTALNAADFQIGATTRVLLNFPQLKPMIEARPAAEHAMRVCPKLGQEAPIRLPEAWLPPRAVTLRD